MSKMFVPIKQILKKYFIFFSPFVTAIVFIGFISFISRWKICCVGHWPSLHYVIPLFAFLIFAVTIVYAPFFYMYMGALIGDANCEYAIGASYLKGQFVRKNYAKALKWLGRASDQKHTLARFYLSNMYMDGKGMPQDTAQAERITQQMAEDGEDWSLRTVGITYQYNFGYKKDYSQAYAWLSIAMLKAETYKKKSKLLSSLYRLTQKMTPSQIEEGERLYTVLAPFTKMDSQPRSTIKIVSPPKGKAPLEVREKWVGCELPLFSSDTRAIAIWTTASALPTGFFSFWLGVFRGRIVKQKGYPVNSKAALEIIGSLSSEAKNWYVENLPHCNNSWACMLFESSCCSLIEADVA